MNKNKLILVLSAIGIAFSISTKVSASSNIQRIWGNDRYATAIEVSQNGWVDGSEYAVLANGENFPDALSAAPLAKKYNAPILLNPSVALDSRVEGELKRLGVKQIFIVGGSSVLSDTVKDRLEKLNIKTTRLWGQNRYETSIKIAEQLDFSGQVAIANGEGFADALSISPIAAQKSMPVILVPPNTLSYATAKYIKNNKITKTYIVGESDVVSDNIANSFPNSERIWGSSKYDTNIAVLNKFKSDLDLSNIYLANGENFPDALAGSALAAKNSSAIALVNNDAGQTTKDFMFSNITSKCKTNVLGGNGVIPTGLIDDMLSLVGNTNANLIFGGHEAKQGEWIYYTSGYGPLYKSKEAGSSVTKLFDFDAEVTDWNSRMMYSLNVVGDWVYYCGSDGIYKIKTDGSSNTKIIGESNSQANIYPMIVVEDAIYYSLYSEKDGKSYLYKVNTDGSGKTILSEENYIRDLNIYEDWAYYVKNDGVDEVYKVKLDGSNKAKVEGIDGYVPELLVDNGFIYYSTQNGIYKKKTDDSETTCIVNGSNIYPRFNIANNFIYYSSHDGGLYKIKSDGSGNVKLIDGNSLKSDFAERYKLPELNIKIVGNCGITVNDIKGDWIYYECSFPTTGEDQLHYPYKIKIDGSENKPAF